MPPTKPRTGRRQSSRNRDLSPGGNADVEGDAAVPYHTEEVETAAPMDAQVVRPGTLTEGPARSDQQTAGGLVPNLHRKKKRRPSRHHRNESMTFEPEDSHARPGSVTPTWSSISGPDDVDGGAISWASNNEAAQKELMAGSGQTFHLPAPQGMMTFADMQAQGYQPSLTQVPFSFLPTLGEIPPPEASAGPVHGPTVPAPALPQVAPRVQLPAQAPQAASTAQPRELLQSERIPILASSQGSAPATAFGETTGSGSVPDFTATVPVSPDLPPARDGRAQRLNNDSLYVDVAEKSYAQDSTAADCSGGRTHPSATKPQPGAAKGKLQSSRIIREARTEFSKKGDEPEFEYADEMPMQSQKLTVGATKNAASTDYGAALRHQSVMQESPPTPTEAYGRTAVAGARRMVAADAIVLDPQLANRLVTVLSKVEKLALAHDENRVRPRQELDERNMMVPAKSQGVNISIQCPFSQKAHYRSRGSEEVVEDGSDDDNEDGGDDDDDEERQYSDKRESKRRLKKSVSYIRRSASEESFQGPATGPQRRRQNARSAEKPRRRIPGSLSREDEDEEPSYEEVSETRSISGWPSHLNYQYNRMPAPAREPSTAFGTGQIYLYPGYPPQKYPEALRYPGIGRPFGPIYSQSRMPAPFPQPGAKEFLYNDRSAFDPFNRPVSQGPRSNFWAPEQYPYLNDIPPGNNYAQRTAYTPNLPEVSAKYSVASETRTHPDATLNTRSRNYGSLQAFSSGAGNEQQLQQPQQHCCKPLQEGGCPANSALPDTSHTYLAGPHHQPPNAPLNENTVPCGPGDPPKTASEENFASKRTLTFATPGLKARSRGDKRTTFRMAVTPRPTHLARDKQDAARAGSVLPQVTTASGVAHRAPAKVIAYSGRKPMAAENTRCLPPRVNQTNLRVAAPSCFGKAAPTALPRRRSNVGPGGLQHEKYRRQQEGVSLEELLRYEDDMRWEEEMRERSRRLREERIREEERLLLRERLLEQQRLLREEFRADLHRKRGTDDMLLRLVERQQEELEARANAAAMEILAKAQERKVSFTSPKPVQDAEVQAGCESEPLFRKDGEIEPGMTVSLGAKKFERKTRRQCSDAGLERQPPSRRP